MTMNRRRLLSLSSAAALAFMLPLPAAKAVAPDYAAMGINIGKLDLIEKAVDLGRILGFTIPERLEHFGFHRRSVTTEHSLRDLVQNYVIQFRHIGVWNRVRFLAAIQGELERFYPNNIRMRNYWLNTYITSGGRLRDLLIKPSQFELQRLASIMGTDLDFHGFEEAAAYV